MSRHLPALRPCITCIMELDPFLKKPENIFYWSYFQTTAVGFEDPALQPNTQETVFNRCHL